MKLRAKLVFPDATTQATAATVPPPLVLASGENYIVPANAQVLFAMPIVVDGELVIDGAFIEVN